MVTDQPTIVSPSVDQLVVRSRALVATGERRLLGITGGPGSGKSTLGAALVEAMGRDAVLVGADGFHLSNQELRRLGRSDRKGAPTPSTSMAMSHCSRSCGTRSNRWCTRRCSTGALKNPSPPRRRCLPTRPWLSPKAIISFSGSMAGSNVRRYLDAAGFVDIARDLRRQRLIPRRRSFGHSATAAAEWVQTVDKRNAALVEEAAPAATLLVTMTETLTQEPQQTN